MYIAVLSYENKLPYNRLELFKKIFTDSESYCFGFLVASSSIGLFEYNAKEDLMITTAVNPLFTSQLIKSQLILRNIDGIGKDFIPKIEEYFLH